MRKLELYGFNDLTRDLSLCIYDICYTRTVEERDNCITYINKLYDANRLTEIPTEACSTTGANILNIARQDYESQGASVAIPVSEEPVDPELIDQTEHPDPLPETAVAHLDESHICVRTCPKSRPGGGLCTFHADIEVSTYGVISPLRVLNYLIHQLGSDIMTINYHVRSFTYDIGGMKHFIDHEISSIQNFMPGDIRSPYDMVDVNVYQGSTFHTKMLLKELDLKHCMLRARPGELTTEERKVITDLLWKEMREIYYGRNVPAVQYWECPAALALAGPRILRRLVARVRHQPLPEDFPCSRYT